MATFKDLSPYQYALSRFTVQPDALNIGWLGAGVTLTTGPVPMQVIDRLKALCARPVNLCRGSHTCDLCSHPIEGRWPAGNGEIRVTSKQGVIFAAPVLIVHYIEEHKYQPPQVFIDAVMDASDDKAVTHG